MINRRIFKDVILENEINENGFVKIKLFNQKEIDEVESLYLNTEDQISSAGFYASINNTNKEIVKEINTKIELIYHKKVTALLYDYKFLFTNYVVKSPSNDGEVGLHQDWTYVDESKFRSVNIWFPLVETNKENGALKILAKSHQIPNFIRSLPYDNEFYAKANDLVGHKLKFISTILGEVIIFDSRVFHCSNPNVTKDKRIACAAIYIPNETNAIHYQVDNNQLKKYEVDTNFFVNLSMNVKPASDNFTIINHKAQREDALIFEFLKQL